MLKTTTRGKPERIGAVGLEILYYYVPEGTVYVDSGETQKIDRIHTERQNRLHDDGSNHVTVIVLLCLIMEKIIYNVN